VRRKARGRIPLNCPVHGGVGGHERRNDVENLASESAEGVEDGSVESTSERALTVGRQGVGGNALGSRAT
jgi:hypothetical protein